MTAAPFARRTCLLSWMVGLPNERGARGGPEPIWGDCGACAVNLQGVMSAVPPEFGENVQVSCDLRAKRQADGCCEAPTCRVVVVRVVGALDLVTAPGLREALRVALGAHRRVVVDLASAQTVDSVGLSVLVRARLAAYRGSGELALAAASPLIRSALRATGLDKVFPLFGTAGQAIASLRG